MIGSKSPTQAKCEITNDHGFTLKTEDKTYTLFTRTRDEAQIWVRILSLICEMNRRGISIDQVNPFDFESLKHHKKALQEKKIQIKEKEKLEINPLSE